MGLSGRQVKGAQLNSAARVRRAVALGGAPQRDERPPHDRVAAQRRRAGMKRRRRRIEIRLNFPGRERSLLEDDDLAVVVSGRQMVAGVNRPSTPSAQTALAGAARSAVPLGVAVGQPDAGDEPRSFGAGRYLSRAQWLRASAC